MIVKFGNIYRSGNTVFLNLTNLFIGWFCGTVPKKHNEIYVKFANLAALLYHTEANGVITKKGQVKTTPGSGSLRSREAC